MNKRYSIFAAPVLAFGSPSFYDDVARRWRGVAFFYLFLLLALTMLVPTIKGYVGVTTWMRQSGSAVVQQLPAITIQNGKLAIDRPEPYAMREPGSGKPIVVFDSTEQSAEAQDPEVKVVVTQTKIHTRQSPHEVRTYDLSQVQHFEMDAAKVQGWIDQWSGRIAVILYLLFLLVSIVYRMVQALIFGLIVMGLASAMGKRIGYAAGIRLAVMAVTPVILIDTVLWLVGGPGLSGCLWWLICLAVDGLYLVLAAYWVKSAPAETVDAMIPVPPAPWNDPGV